MESEEYYTRLKGCHRFLTELISLDHDFMLLFDWKMVSLHFFPHPVDVQVGQRGDLWLLEWESVKLHEATSAKGK